LLADFEPALKSKRRKPDWLKVRPPGAGRYARIKEALRRLGLHTVCEGARCPNLHECWGSGTATLMLFGEVCTRGCRFCAVAKGRPEPPDPDEPKKVAQAVAEWGLEYVVLTSVSRDDLSRRRGRPLRQDGRGDQKEGALPPWSRSSSPTSRATSEPSSGSSRPGPDVIGHNIETVERLTPLVRDRRASYRQSLKVLEQAKRLAPSVYTKSALMLGLGETEERGLGNDAGPSGPWVWTSWPLGSISSRRSGISRSGNTSHRRGSSITPAWERSSASWPWPPVRWSGAPTAPGSFS
jgi:lipoic acid synthetase